MCVINKLKASVYTSGKLAEEVTLDLQEREYASAAKWQHHYDWWAGKLASGSYSVVNIHDTFCPFNTLSKYRIGTDGVVGSVSYAPSSYQTSYLNNNRYPVGVWSNTNKFTKLAAAGIGSHCDTLSPLKHTAIAATNFSGSDVVITETATAAGDVNTRPTITNDPQFVAGHVLPVFDSNGGLVTLDRVANRVVKIDIPTTGFEAFYGTDPINTFFAVTDKYGWFSRSVNMVYPDNPLLNERWGTVVTLVTHPGETAKTTQRGEEFLWTVYTTNGKVSWDTDITIKITQSPSSLVTVAPTANFTANKTTINVGESVTFTDTSTNSPTFYSWDFGNSTYSVSKTPSAVQYDTPGKFTVSLSVANAAGVDDEVKTDYITVNTVAPTAAFTGSPTSGAAPLTVTFTNT